MNESMLPPFAERNVARSQGANSEGLMRSFDAVRKVHSVIEARDLNDDHLYKEILIEVRICIWHLSAELQVPF
jgi:hypothetical protein